MQPDYTIVGHGLAGAVLAHSILQQGKRVRVIDNNPNSSSSKVAAGVFNPIVVKRVSKSWRADELFPFAQTFYRKLEEEWRESFYHPRPLARVMNDVLEQNVWMERMGNPVFDGYLDDRKIEELETGPFNMPMGYAVVNHAGNLDIPKFLNASKEVLIRNEAYEQGTFDHENAGSGKAPIIFCEGHQGANNPWFNWLPFALTKGEVLLIRSEVKLTTILNKKIFILPLSNGLFKVGSTFDWKNVNEEVTEPAKAELIKKLDVFFKGDYEVIEQQAAIRPTVKDRKPLVGRHPKHKHLILFNGLGAKGVSYAPWLANNLINHLEKGLPLDAEADIQRYHGLLTE